MVRAYYLGVSRNFTQCQFTFSSIRSFQKRHYSVCISTLTPLWASPPPMHPRATCIALAPRRHLIPRQSSFTTTRTPFSIAMIIHFVRLPTYHIVYQGVLLHPTVPGIQYVYRRDVQLSTHRTARPAPPRRRGGARIQPVACARRCARAPRSPCRRVGGRTAHRSLGRSVYEMSRRPMNGSPSPASIQRQQRRERAKLSRVKRPPGRPSSWDSDGCRERVVDAMRLDGFFGPFTLGRGRYHTVARVCSATVRRHATACKLFGTSGVRGVRCR
jgi:hypothetical protein